MQSNEDPIIRKEGARRLRNIARGLGGDWTAEKVRQFFLKELPADMQAPEWLRYPIEDEAPHE